MTRIAFVTLGCKVNQFDTDMMGSSLLQNGYEIVPFEEGAEIYVINTCTVTGKGDGESRRLIRKAKKLNRHAKIIVTGCYAQIAPGEVADIDGVTAVLGNLEKDNLIQYLKEIGDHKENIFVKDIFSAGSIDLPDISLLTSRSRAVLKIQDGCDSRCSYCIVPFSRGRSRSLEPGKVINMIKDLHRKGLKEVVLCGVHLGGYGRDLAQVLTLEDLIRRILKETNIERIRLSSIEPREITQGLIELMALEKRLCPHFHIPLQSGDNEILRNMNRNYDAPFYENLIFKIKDRIPEAAIGCDVIVGYPGEGEKEFENTLTFVKRLPITYIHVFAYSPRKGTIAYSLKDPVRGDIKRERSRILRSVGEEKSRVFKQQYIGRSVNVLVEEEADEETGLFKGYTDNYIRVLIRNCDPSFIKQIVEVHIDGFSGDSLSGNISR